MELNNAINLILSFANEHRERSICSIGIANLPKAALDLNQRLPAKLENMNYNYQITV